MVVYYAMGGGLGHLVRARAVLHTLGLEGDAVLLTASPYARDRRVVGAVPVRAAPAECVAEPAAYRRWLAETLRQLAPREVFVDTFPGGLLGELAGLVELTAGRLTYACGYVYVGRLLRWEAYAAALATTSTSSTPIRFGRALLVEPLHPAHEAAVLSCADEIVRLDVDDLRDPPADDLAALPLDLPDRFWLVVHSGPPDEIAELVAYARDLQRLEDDPAPLVLVSPAASPPPEATTPSLDPNLGLGPPPDRLRRVDLYPASALFPRAARVVSACGYNVMRQMAAYADRHRFLPLPRRYDDQFARAARWRAAHPNPVAGTQL